MKPKEWNRYRDKLEDSLREIEWSFSRVLRTGESKIIIEGGDLPIDFELDDDKCFVWGKCSRISHGYVSIDELVKLKEICVQWRKWLKNELI